MSAKADHQTLNPGIDFRRTSHVSRQLTPPANSHKPTSATSAANSEQVSANGSCSRRALGTKTTTIQPNAVNIATERNVSMGLRGLDTAVWEWGGLLEGHHG